MSGRRHFSVARVHHHDRDDDGDGDRDRTTTQCDDAAALRRLAERVDDLVEQVAGRDEGASDSGATRPSSVDRDGLDAVGALAGMDRRADTASASSDGFDTVGALASMDRREDASPDDSGDHHAIGALDGLNRRDA